MQAHLLPCITFSSSFAYLCQFSWLLSAWVVTSYFLFIERSSLLFRQRSFVKRAGITWGQRTKGISSSPFFIFSPPVPQPALSYQPGLFVRLVLCLSSVLWHHTSAVVVELCSLLSFSVCRPLLAFLRATVFWPPHLVVLMCASLSGDVWRRGEESEREKKQRAFVLSFSSVSCSLLLVVRVALRLLEREQDPHCAIVQKTAKFKHTCRWATRRKEAV